MSNIHLQPRVVLYREAGSWVAHCLEFDLVGAGDTREEAFEQLNAAIAIQVDANSLRSAPADLFKPAELEYFAMFDAGRDVAVGTLHLASHHMIIDNISAREFVNA